MPCNHILNDEGEVIGHICTSFYGWGSWEAVPRGFDNIKKGMVLTDCCVCYMPLEEARYRCEITNVESWYPPLREVCCAPGFGCDANPRRSNGAALRAAMFEELQ